MQYHSFINLLMAVPEEHPFENIQKEIFNWKLIQIPFIDRDMIKKFYSRLHSNILITPTPPAITFTLWVRLHSVRDDRQTRDICGGKEEVEMRLGLDRTRAPMY